MLLLPILLNSPVALAPVPAASDLDVTRISADATWVIHVDAEALRATDLWRVFRDEMRVGGALDLDQDELDEWRDFEREFGIRPLEDVDAITVSGSGDLGDDPVIMIETDEILDRALSVLQQKGEYRSFDRDGVTLHGWERDGDDGAFYIHKDGRRRLRFQALTRECDRCVARQGSEPAREW